MKHLLGFAALIFVGFAGWQLGGRLSSDAIGMALGVLFGVTAGIPASLMMLAARRYDDYYDDPPPHRRYEDRQALPPIIVVTGQNPRWNEREWQIHTNTRQIDGSTD